MNEGKIKASPPTPLSKPILGYLTRKRKTTLALGLDYNSGMQTLKAYAFQFIGRPYDFGGNNPMQGFDCSGFVGELLHAGGAYPDSNLRYTAQEFYNHFSQPANHMGQDPVLGALVFFGLNANAITHIGWMLDNKRMIEAGGGGSAVTNLEEAETHNAFIKIRPVNFGATFRGCFLPDYSAIQL